MRLLRNGNDAHSRASLHSRYFLSDSSSVEGMLALECFCWLFSTEFPAIITATARYCGCSRAAASQGQPANRAPSRLPLHLCYDLARIWSNDDLGTRCEHRQRNELYQVCPIGAVELKCRQPNKNEAIPLPRRGHRVRATTSHPPLQSALCAAQKYTTCRAIMRSSLWKFVVLLLAASSQQTAPLNITT